jgi:hypothetical protein
MPGCPGLNNTSRRLHVCQAKKGTKKKAAEQQQSAPEPAQQSAQTQAEVEQQQAEGERVEMEAEASAATLEVAAAEQPAAQQQAVAVVPSRQQVRACPYVWYAQGDTPLISCLHMNPFFPPSSRPPFLASFFLSFPILSEGPRGGAGELQRGVEDRAGRHRGAGERGGACLPGAPPF